MTLEIRLLGGFEVWWDGAPVTAFRSQKARALLAYLALHAGRPLTRGALAGLFWPDYAPARAAHNLRQTLTRLRQALAPLPATSLHATHQEISLHLGSEHWLDVAVFERRLGEQPGKGWAEAIDLYRGDLLAGFFVDEAPAFEIWLLAERERLRTLALAALHWLAEFRTTRGEYAAASGYFAQTLALDPWRESAHRGLMRAMALSGDPAAALGQYEKCRRALAEGLGVEPVEATTALYARIRAGELLPGSPAPQPPISTAPALPFVGREAEHARLAAAWEQARQGAGQLTLVEGEVGVGKTRLAEEVLRYAAARGASVLRGRCYEFSAAIAYQPITAALRSALSSANFSPTASHPDSLAPIWLAELSRLLPELRQIWPDLPQPVEASGEAAQQRLFEAVARVLEALAAKRRTAVIFLDDLHWIDQASLDLLHYLVRRLANAPLWFLGAYRREELHLDHPLLLLRRALSRDGRVALVRLQPLEPRDIACEAQGIPGLDEAEAAQLGEYLARESEGNPFILTELLQDLVERGRLLRSDAGDGIEPGRSDGWRLASDWSGPAAEPGVPFAVREVVLGRTARLPARSRDLLHLAAVIGREFDLRLLSAASGDDARVMDESMGAWLARGLVRSRVAGVGGGRKKGVRGVRAQPHPPHTLFSEPPTPGLFDFTHDKIRAVMYHALEAGERSSLHRQVGAALERLHADQLEPHYEQLAHHFEQAEAVDKALLYLPLAAAKAADVYANLQALETYDRALALAPEEDERRWEMLLLQAQILQLVGEHGRALAACQQVLEGGDELWQARAAEALSAIYRARRDYDQARAWAEQAYDLAAAAGEQAERENLRERARAKQALGEVEKEQGNLQLAQELFEAALALYRALADQRGTAECLNGLGDVFSAWGRYDAARQRFQQALPVFQALGDRQSEAACLRAIGMTHWRQGAYAVAQRAFNESLDIYRAIGDRPGEARCLNQLGMAYIAQAAYDETRRCWEESVALYRSLGLEQRAAFGLHNLGILHIEQGAYAAAQQCLEESLAIDRAAGAKSRQALNLGWLGKLHFSRGEYDQARRCLEAALALEREMGGGEEQGWHLVWQAAVAFETGDLAGAKAYLQQAFQLAGERGKGLDLPEAHRWLAEVHLAQGDGEAALAAARQALAESEEAGEQRAGIPSALLGSVYGSGLLEAAEDPRPYFERALALLPDGNLPEYGIALRRYGAYLLRSGDREQGAEYLQQAQAIFERIGARGELAKVEITSPQSPSAHRPRK